MRSNTTHLPVPAYLTALVEQVEAAGYFLRGESGSTQHFQSFAGMSQSTGALQCARGTRLVTDADPLVARLGFALVSVAIANSYVPVVLELAGITTILDDGVTGDLYGALTEHLAGVAPVPMGTGDLTRSEVKQAFFTMCYSGTGVRVRPTVEDLRLLAAITGLTWVLPELAAAADKDGFNARVHRKSNDVAWRLLGQAHERLTGLAHAVALGPHEVYLEVYPHDVEQVIGLVEGLALDNMRVTADLVRPAAPAA